MKTAILKTTIWEDDVFFKLNIDTKLLYLYFLTTPKRDIGRIFKQNNRLAIAYTGLSEDQIKICTEQLVQNNLIKEYEGYIYLNDTGYSVPKSGRFTSVALKRELVGIPDEVLDYFAIEKPNRELIENIKEYRQEMKRDSFREKVLSLKQVCVSCGSTDNLSVDHIIALHSGGNNDISNLQILCVSCNSKKGINRNLPEEYRLIAEHKDKDKDIDNVLDRDKDTGYRAFQSRKAQLLGRI